jgi:hypothetical protein
LLDHERAGKAIYARSEFDRKASNTIYTDHQRVCKKETPPFFPKTIDKLFDQHGLKQEVDFLD